eukprot:scaffold120559_cov63-Phaeocystis_antarctica.AAC.4
MWCSHERQSAVDPLVGFPVFSSQRARGSSGGFAGRTPVRRRPALWALHLAAGSALPSSVGDGDASG